jgi:hypothetical protein
VGGGEAEMKSWRLTTDRVLFYWRRFENAMQKPVEYTDGWDGRGLEGCIIVFQLTNWNL